MHPHASCLLLVLLAAAAHAADGADEGPYIPEIIVTAEFRDDDVNRIPTSVSVITDDIIERRAAQHLEDVLNSVPNVNYSKGSSRARFLQIRGIGERGQFVEPLNSSVGLIIDGVDFSGIGTVGTLYDVEQIEILRGPQGTLYGANALAGLVNVITKIPSDEFEASIQLQAGEYGMRKIGAAFSGPVSDRVRYRVAAEKYAIDGFMDNAFFESDNTDDQDELTLRGKLSIDLSETAELNLTGGVIDVDNGYDAFSLDNNRTTHADEPGRDRQESAYGAAEFIWTGSDAYTLEARIGVAASDIDYGYDEDWTFVGFHSDGYSSTDRYIRDRATTTAELRFVSNEDGRLFDGTTHWTAGIYALDQSVDLRREYTFLTAPFTSEFAMDRIAAFGQIETPLANRSMLTVGLRLERHEARYTDSEGVTFKPTDDMIGGRIALEHQFGDQTIGYVSYSRGYKAGGSNTDGTLDADLRQFQPEDLDNIEAGVKAVWADGRAATRLAVFRMNRHDVQIASSIVRIRPDDSAEFIDFIGNAARGVNTGVEVEFSYVPNRNLEFFGGIGLLDTEYEEFINVIGDDLSGREQAQAPGYQYSLGVEASTDRGFFARLTVEGRDDYYFSDSHDARSRSYNIVNAVLGYETTKWSVTLWGRNLADEDYFVRGFFFGNDPRDGYTSRVFTQLGEPRRLGVTFRHDWR